MSVTFNPVKDMLQTMNDNGVTDGEIAGKLDIGTSCITQYRHGKNLPSILTFARMCIALNLSSFEIGGMINDLAVMHIEKTRVIRSKFSDKTRVFVMHLLKQGLSVPTVVARTGVRPSTVYKYKGEMVDGVQ